MCAYNDSVNHSGTNDRKGHKVYPSTRNELGSRVMSKPGYFHEIKHSQCLTRYYLIFSHSSLITPSTNASTGYLS